MTEPFLHPCVEPGCTEEGCIGEGVSLRKGQTGTWRCARHDREHRARRRPAEPQQGAKQPTRSRSQQALDL